MKWSFILAAGLSFVCSSVQAEPALSKLDCTQQDSGLVYDCLFTLIDKATGAPVTDAEFKIHTTMPSMPMAHNSPPVEAVKGELPGTYLARIPLDMYGTWRLKLNLTQPEPAQLDRTVDFTP